MLHIAKTLLVKTAIKAMNPQIKKKEQARHTKKKEYRKQMIKMFGRTRYYLSVWFGPWILYEGRS